MERNNLVLPFFQWRFDRDDRRQVEKRVSDKVNQLSRTSAADLESLSEKVETYVNLLAKNRLKDENVARKLDWGFLRYFVVIAGFPLFVAGFLSNFIPFLIPRYICDKLIKDPRFYSSVYVSSGTVLYLIYFPLLLILATVFFGWWGFAAALLIPLAGYFVLYYQEILRERLYTTRYFLIKFTNPALIKELVARRKEILGVMGKVEI
jgi:hypothetical protein